MKTYEFEVGGNLVEMTASQAAAWNSADVTAHTMAGAKIFVPAVDRNRIPDGAWVDLWQWIEANPDDQSLQQPATMYVGM